MMTAERFEARWPEVFGALCLAVDATFGEDVEDVDFAPLVEAAVERYVEGAVDEYVRRRSS